MQLTRYDPFQELQNIERDLDRLWGNNRGLTSLNGFSKMDLYEEDGYLVSEVSLPNFKKNEIKVSTDEGVLEISAHHQEEQEKKNKRRYFFHESSNQYFRRVALPEGAKASKANATFKDGVLRISIPMTAASTSKEVEIK